MSKTKKFRPIAFMLTILMMFTIYAPTMAVYAAADVTAVSEYYEINNDDDYICSGTGDGGSITAGTSVHEFKSKITTSSSGVTIVSIELYDTDNDNALLDDYTLIYDVETTLEIAYEYGLDGSATRAYAVIIGGVSSDVYDVDNEKFTISDTGGLPITSTTGLEAFIGNITYDSMYYDFSLEYDANNNGPDAGDDRMEIDPLRPADSPNKIFLKLFYNYGDNYGNLFRTYTIDVEGGTTDSGDDTTIDVPAATHHHRTVVAPESVKNLLLFNIGEMDSFLKLGSSSEERKPMDAAPILLDNRTLLPIRFVVEPLGGTIEWSNSDDKVTIKRGDKTIELWIGKNIAKINGVDTLIDPNNPNVMPMIVNPGRTMLPLRFISEALGCTVDWEEATQKVTVQF